MGEAEQAQPVTLPAPAEHGLIYERQPQRAAVVENGHVVELVIPADRAWRVTVVRQALYAGLAVAFSSLFLLPGALSGGTPWVTTGVMLGVYAVVFGTITIHRVRSMPRLTVLEWDGQTLRAPVYYLAAGNDQTAGDPVKWSRSTLADLVVHPLWPGPLTKCGTVKVVSRFDYPMYLGVSPINELREAVERFRTIVLAPALPNEPIP